MPQRMFTTLLETPGNAAPKPGDLVLVDVPLNCTIHSADATRLSGGKIQMTRCSYIPTEGQSIIAVAKERGGTTDGDIAALLDRYGCKADATHEIAIGDADDPDELREACVDHVGHLLSDGGCWVHRIELAEVTMSILHTSGIAREGFGPALILSPTPSATPIVDLGTNPTGEQVRAAGFVDDSEAYRKAREANTHRPPPVSAPSGLMLRCGSTEACLLHPTRVTPGWDGNSATQTIAGPMYTHQLDVLAAWHRARAMLQIGSAQERYAIVERYISGGVADERDVVIVLKQVQIVRAAVNAVPGAYKMYSGSGATASGLCNAVLAVSGVNCVAVVEYDHGKIEAFVDGGEPDAIAGCIYDYTWPGVELRGQETVSIGNDSLVQFSRGAAAMACRRSGSDGIIRITAARRRRPTA